MKSLLFEVDEHFMNRAIELARLGMGNVAPNPMVGCVIVHDGLIIGEGYHREYGKPHAEVNAINNVINKALLKESTLYVTLEPCAHFGKTPPCADLIVKWGIPDVVVGIVDPFVGVSGKGIEKLRKNGCNVTEGVLEDRCRELNRRFFTYHKKRRPYIILKWAQTADGFIDIDRSQENYGQPTWITNDLSKIAVHKMRSDEAAILVGTNTAQKDNPSLNVREWHGKSPLRIVIDKDLRLSNDLSLFDQRIPTIVYTSVEVQGKTNLEFRQVAFDQNLLNSILKDMHENGIQSLIVEGGQLLLNSFIEQGLWDEARVFVGQKSFYKGIRAPKFDALKIKSEELDDSDLFVYYNNAI